MNDSEYDALELTELLDTLVKHREKSDPLIRQVDVAKAMGVGQPTVSELERGVVSPKVSTLQAYARAVGFKLKLGIKEA